MSEMLGNQYFLARKFCEALTELEEALNRDPLNKSIRKKLIICYIKTNQLDKAVTHFIHLIKEDVHFIINTDPILDDCPCPEIIYELENTLETKDAIERNIALGMLWLYCDLSISIKYFLELPPSDEIRFILNKLNESNNQTNSTELQNGSEKN